MREHAMTAIEPAVGSPDETVERLVRILQSPAVEHDARRAGGFVLAGFDRDEEQLRRLPHPDAAEAEFDSGDEVQPFVEDSALVEDSVAIGILEDQDAVLRVLRRQLERI